MCGRTFSNSARIVAKCFRYDNIIHVDRCTLIRGRRKMDYNNAQAYKYLRAARYNAALPCPMVIIRINFRLSED